MPGNGPFLWLAKGAPPAGFWELPPGGMCLSAFLFVTHVDRILLGKYKDDPKWEELAGLDPDFRRIHGQGWTIPASQLKFGEDPRDAARRVGEKILQIPGMKYSEPRVETDFYEPKRFPGALHYDVWFLFDGTLTGNWKLQMPPWYAELAWHDPTRVSPSAYARGHEDVVARWMQRRT